MLLYDSEKNAQEFKEVLGISISCIWDEKILS